MTAFGMDPELLSALLVAVVDLLLVPVLAEAARRHEPSAREVVRGVAGLFHLVEILLGEEAAVRERRLVDRAQLVDVELGVGDASAPPTPALGGTTQGRPADHLLEHPIAELHPVQQRRGVVPEQPTVQRADGEAVGPGAAPGEEVAAGAFEAVTDQPKQGLDAVVQVVAVQLLLAGQAHHLQIAQPFQAVALAVRLRLDRVCSRSSG